MALVKAGRTMKIASTLGRVVIVLSVLIMLSAGVNRLVLISQAPATSEAFDIRYFQHPWVAIIHIVPGLLFLTLAPLQFVARILQRRISIHRGLGLAALSAWGVEHFQGLTAGLESPVSLPGEAPEAARLRLEAYIAAGLTLFHDFLRVAGALSLLAVAPAIFMRQDREP